MNAPDHEHFQEARSASSLDLAAILALPRFHGLAHRLISSGRSKRFIEVDVSWEEGGGALDAVRNLPKASLFRETAIQC